ncbi:YceI family protein [Mariniflexile gromovii]|uniref:YceI family protein n=1 Tax=Mariniflexile gromovii TaxID=362523 RepID=A0ABS4BXS7_9FLAO|nr:YceI family protein [Mariniflexile gromovii]MBP0905393.1 YceI family protein [Mariniflexile gromovii]
MMIIKKFVFLIAILTAVAFTTRDSVSKSTSVVITAESSLFVKGTTNVSNFSCVFNINKFKNPIQVTYHLKSDKMVFNKTALILETDCFDCGGKAINSDFQKILKADRYPQIKLYLKEISQIENTLDVHALVNIEIAGITKSYKIPVKVKNNETLRIAGDLRISLSDYNLEAPKKIFGLISVDDKIEIHFQLGVIEK